MRLRVSQVENWRWQVLFRLREQLINEGIPVFSRPGWAAAAMSKFVDYHRYQKEVRERQ
ncbi:MAG: hypothetical protein ACOX1X_02400 [Dethiobacteria bacterium]|jgi:acyl-CoA synthetase (NDP forming)